MLKFPGVKVRGYSGYGENEADVPDSVVKHSLKRGSVCVGTSVPSANKKERYNPYTFSSNEDLEYVVCCDENNYCDQEGKEIFEEPVYIGV